MQLAGRRVVFEPHAIVWAEEPRDIAGLWKQRLRWGRGNVQVTLRYRRYWLRRKAGRLGGLSFALIWFAVFLMPVLMVLSSVSLVALFVLDRELSIDVFRSLWALNLVTYLFVTLAAFAYDGPAARRSWFEAITLPRADQPGDHRLGRARAGRSTTHRTGCCCSPTCGCRRRCSPRISCGGSRRCARRRGWRGRCCTSSATARCCAPSPPPRTSRSCGGAELAWEKTEKTGTVGRPGMSEDFESELAADERFERRLFWRQLAIVAVVAA